MHTEYTKPPIKRHLFEAIERHIKKHHKEGMQQPQPQTYDIADAYPWVLYALPEKHVKEISIVKHANLDNYILIQNMNKCTTKPAWLNVLPVLVDTRNKLAYRGQTCYSQLIKIEIPPEYMSKHHKRQKTLWTDDAHLQ